MALVNIKMNHWWHNLLLLYNLNCYFHGLFVNFISLELRYCSLNTTIKQLRGKVVVLLAGGVPVELASSWWGTGFRKPVAVCWRESQTCPE